MFNEHGGSAAEIGCGAADSYVQVIVRLGGIALGYGLDDLGFECW
jgi:hypothetical protein